MIVGLCGYAKSGKNWLADQIGGRQLAFADALKRKLCIACDITPQTLAEKKDQFRPLMVLLGETMRVIDPQYWIKQLEQYTWGYSGDPALEEWRTDGVGNTDRHPAHNEDYIVTDVRYVNEAKWVRGLGGHVVRVLRDGVNAANKTEEAPINAILDARLLDGAVLNNGESGLTELRRLMTAWRAEDAKCLATKKK